MALQEQEQDIPLTDALAGRWLAWIGGAATLVGICLLLAMAISHGWIGRSGRIVLAGGASAALLATGAWLRDRLGRIQAPLAMICAGTIGGYVTAIAASQVYGLLSPAVTEIAATAAGGVATWLAIRWRHGLIGAVGLIGPLAVPWFLGGATSPVIALPLSALTAACLAVAVRQRWGRVAVAVIVVGGIDALGAIGAASTVSSADLWLMAPVGLAGLAAAVMLQRRSGEGRSRPATTVLVTTGALLAGALGVGALAGFGTDSLPFSHLGASLWLGAVIAGFVAVAGLAWGRPAVEPLLATALALIALLADLLMAIDLHGFALTLGWGACALALAAVRRRRAERVSDRALVDIGLAGHAGLVLIRTLLAAPPRTVGSGSISLDGAVAVATLALICLAGTGSRHDRTEYLPTVLGVLGLVSIFYVSAVTLTGVGLVLAWAGEATALAAIARREQDPVAIAGALGFLGAAWVYTLGCEAPPPALLTGVQDLPAAVGALAACGIATEGIRRARLSPVPEDIWFIVPAVAAPLYLASVALITVFQPAVGVGIELLDLGVRQQGQVLLSALWAVSGLVALIVGLRRGLPGIRNGGLIVLAVSAVKVFLYDLSTLTSIYRVVSMIVLGLLFLAGGLAYQRLRPPALPDLRDTTPRNDRLAPLS